MVSGPQKHYVESKKRDILMTPFYKDEEQAKLIYDFRSCKVINWNWRVIPGKRGTKELSVML